MATKGCSQLYTVFDLWSGLEDIHEQVNEQNIRLLRLLQVESSDLLSQLVILLLNYYDCDSSTFIFNGHSVAVTLEDILYITGLPIRGIPIMLDPNDKNTFSSIAYFPISKLKDRAKDTSVDPITRMKAALLVLIACFVIPANRRDINVDFVKYVDRLENVDNYAWGAALLAFLHNGIVKWKAVEDKKTLIKGNLWIVLAVFLIRIEKLSQAIGIELDLENAEVPLLHSIVKVVKPISHNRNVKYVNKVKEILDTLSEDDIRWVPYKQYELPGILKDQEKYKLLLSPICCMDSIVHHRPHLAPRQFEELEHLDLSKLTWPETILQNFSVLELAQWNDGKLVTDYVPGYGEEGPSRHNEETSISRDAIALEYENPNHSNFLLGCEEEGLSHYNEKTSISRDAVALEYGSPSHSESREIPLVTSMQIIESLNSCNEELMSDPSQTSISSAAAFGYENAHHSESRENGTNHSELDKNGANHSKLDDNCANHSELGENVAKMSTRGMLTNPPQKFNPSRKPKKKKRKGIVCVTCGDIGFKEATVLCNKCEACGLHRYCLDGPVILKDDVTWFCEDCEPKAIEPGSPDQPTLLSSKSTDSVTFANNAIQTKTNLKICIDRLKKSKLQLQNGSENADVVKLLNQHDHGASNPLSNSGSYGSDAYA